MEDKQIKTMIVGGGEAGKVVIREMLTTDIINYNPVCVIDDDKEKIGTDIMGVPVVGSTDEIARYVDKYGIEEILITMPSVRKTTIRRIFDICNKTGLKTKVLPGVYQLIRDGVFLNSLRPVEVTDLLGREQVIVKIKEIAGYIKGKVVLVTGGGGSIGSELCRQVCKYAPKSLIIFDIYENNAYDIQQELLKTNPEVDLKVLIGSVRDKFKLEKLFEKYKPDIVFNAAAHKHVPLMEDSPNEAVKNNVFGTLNVATVAEKSGVEIFVQISTDKAVNPTNVMGATKRVCEMIIQAIGKRSKKTKFVAVRFGNVLGSNGSVIPLFKKQIEDGGPVTVTHQDITRFFMTISEAVLLILQAGGFAKSGQIFVLDMGEPVKIYDLAENLIRLSGFEPNVDIPIKIVGLRPGEKLYEERLMAEEGLQKTANGLISIANPIKFNEDLLWTELDELYKSAHEESDDTVALLEKIVPTFKDKKN